jgi:hypothetical protein
MPSLRKAVSDRLRELGYVRLEKSIHLRKLDADFSSCVNTGIVGFATDISPWVGLRSELVEATVPDLMSLEAFPWTASATANVGYILDGQYRRWQKGTDPNVVLDHILRATERLLPYASLDRLSGAFALPVVASNPGAPYTLITIALLQGNHDLVQTLLHEGAARFCKQPNAICEQFRGFERRVRERLATGA